MGVNIWLGSKQSTCRRWAHLKSGAVDKWKMEELRRVLHIVISSMKWQVYLFMQVTTKKLVVS